LGGEKRGGEGGGLKKGKKKRGKEKKSRGGHRRGGKNHGVPGKESNGRTFGDNEGVVAGQCGGKNKKRKRLRGRREGGEGRAGQNRCLGEKLNLQTNRGITKRGKKWGKKV